MKGRVLVIDDNEMDLKVIKLSLERQGYDCTGFTDYREGVVWAETNSVRFIFLDIQMPDINGYDLISLFKSMTIQSEAVIIMVSGRNELEDVKKAVKLGATDYIIKPVDALVLQNKLEKLSQSLRRPDVNQVPLNEKDGAAYISRSISIVELSEFGFRARLTEKQLPDSTLELTGLATQIFGEVHLVARCLSCEIQPDKSYSAQFTFVGLTEPQRQIIRVACRKLWIKLKEAAS